MSLLDIDGPMRDAGCAGKRGIDDGTVHCIGRDQGVQCSDDVRRIEFGQPEIGSLSAAVTHDQHRNLILAGAPRLPNTAAFTGSSRQFALSLEGFQKEGLVSPGNSSFALGTVRGRFLQETVAPQKSGVFIYATALGSLAHTQALNHCLAIAGPLLPFTQISQGRTARWAAGLAAILTTIPGKSMAVAPRMQLPGCAMTVWTAGGASKYIPSSSSLHEELVGSFKATCT